MRSARQIALVMFFIAALLPARESASQDRGNSAIAHEAHKKDKPEHERRSENGEGPISVPEPATIVLLGAAAGVFGVRKMWQWRRGMS
jgi:PEP-CTERM motif